MLSFILFCVACSACAVWLLQRKQWRCTEPPVLPDALPIIGHAPLFMLDNVQLWELMQLVSKLSLEADGVVTLLLGPKTAYVLTDPEDSLTAANACLKKSEFYAFAKDWVGEGLISANVQTWKCHRKLLNPAFSQHVLDGFQGVFNSQARRLVDNMAVELGKGPFDHWPYLALNGLETICYYYYPVSDCVTLTASNCPRVMASTILTTGANPDGVPVIYTYNKTVTGPLTAMGIEMSTEEEQNKAYFQALEEMFEILMERIMKIWLYSDHIFRWTQLKTRQNQLIKVLHNMSNKVLQRRKADLKENNNTVYQYTDYVGGKFKPFLDLMLELADAKGVFNDQEIREHVDTMIVAGHDTSANSLMYTLLLLGSYPDVQEKVYEELQQVFEGSDRDVEKQDVSRLVYMEAVIKESLRLYPIFPVVTRHVDQDVKLKNYTLSPGGLCLIMLYGIHRHPVWGPDAERFRPERWLEPDALPTSPAAFAGFSIGRRGCIGKTYAMMSMKTSLAHILRRFRVSGDHSKLKLKLGVMLKPVSGHHIAIDHRLYNM